MARLVPTMFFFCALVGAPWVHADELAQLRKILVAAEAEGGSVREKEQALTTFFQEFFSDVSSLARHTRISLEETVSVVETVCYSSLHRCVVLLSPRFFSSLTSSDELLVVLGHEMAHLTHDMPILLGYVEGEREVTRLEMELAADHFGAELIPYGACYLRSSLLKSVPVVYANGGTFTEEDVDVYAKRLERLEGQCKHDLKNH